MGKTIGNKNYLELLEQGYTVEQIRGMWKNGETKPKKSAIDIDEVLKDYIKEDIEMTQEVYGDTRYNQPKVEPKATEEQVEETVGSTEIYRQARLAIVRATFLTPEVKTALIQAQRKQVAYGIDKYPEPLNPNTWDINETIEHIMDESIDRLHYLVMLRIKLEQSLVNGAYNDITEVRNLDSRIASINRMISNAIEEMNYIVTLNIVVDLETGVKGPDDILPAAAQAVLDSSRTRPYKYGYKNVYLNKPSFDGLEIEE